MPRALLSVTNKTGIVEFAQGLTELGFEILSTGGTAKALRDAGITVVDVAEVTGFPEILDGRVKTLHPAIHAALLADLDRPDHRQTLEEHGIEPIAVVAVNLYRFAETVQSSHGDPDQATEAIDIGGPSMIRSAAKNAAHVAVVVDPADYAQVLGAIREDRLADLRPELRRKAFSHTAHYDATIATFLSRHSESSLPDTVTLGATRVADLRYGENPHQAGALYALALEDPPIGPSALLWGKELSYNNILDADAARDLVADLGPVACAIIKHGNPCGAAIAPSAAEAFRQAREADPISAFGGIAAFNVPVDDDAAEAMAERGNFFEVILAPSFTPGAIGVFRERSGWGQTVRLLETPIPQKHSPWAIRSVRGGLLVQQQDDRDPAKWTVVTRREPTPYETLGLRFAWSVVKHVKSNAIVVAAGNRLLGVGAGQMNRVQSVRLALEQAGAMAQGAVMAGDAFFPFPDSIEAAADAGITALVHPGGSKKDDDVIAAADRLGLAMVLTGVRHFRH
ncbi:MAG: bifunctional phosphoribosylaminoimidazolecarboxamide formyltransferase/IMP cyclohydrolase [Fimbriimonadaceae bacterium]